MCIPCYVNNTWELHSQVPPKSLCLSIAGKSVTRPSSSVTLCQIMLTKLMHNPHYELEICVFFHNKVITGNEDIEPKWYIKSNWRLSHSLSLISLFLKTPTSFLWGETCCNQNKAETEKLRVMKQLQSIKVEIYTHLWLHCWQAKHSKW